MALLIGAFLAFTVGLLATASGVDMMAAAYLAWLLGSGRLRAAA